jgi:lysophospholipase L1-like esterase
MGKRIRWDALVKFLLALALGAAGVASPRLVGVAYAMQIATTTVSDTVYHADGTTATGTVIVNWPTFTTMTGEVIQGGSQSKAIGTGGALSVALVPNVGATPIGTYYTVVYHLDDGSVQKEYWVIPVSTSSVTIAAVKNTVLPTSVAMQTVSKSYVDTAIATAVSGHPLDSSPYVVKAGDTMTGPLVLPGDPVAANQAADKHYVDTNVAGVSGALAGKVSTLPIATQVVTQPAGTDLETNRLNHVEYASQYATLPNSNGIANATTSADCTGAGAAGAGCVVTVEPSITGTERYNKSNWGYQTHVKDLRRGAQHDTYLNPENPLNPQDLVGQGIDVTTTESNVALAQATGIQDLQATGLEVQHAALAGGSNLFSQELGTVPYFKTNYVGEQVTGTYNTSGQHVLGVMQTNCYAVGDCLIGAQFMYSMGGYRDNSDEGTHPFDIGVVEDSRVFQGLCSTGCTTGSQTLTTASPTAGGTQGDGRYLIDKNPSGVISTGSLTGGSNGTIHPTATFTGTSFPVSTFFQTASLIPSQAHNTAPGTVTVAIVTAGVPAGYSTNTAAAPSSSGVACVAANGLWPNHEMAPYTVVDGTHLQMTLLKPHGANTTIAIGGLCGYGLEQTVDTENGVRQVFPVIGSYSATGLYYAGASTPVVGQMGTTSAYANVNLSILSAVRSGNQVTVTTSGGAGFDLNGLTMTVAGVADSSYNGSFPVTTTGGASFTYTQTGPNSSSTGGTISYVTGGYALYPMAEVLSVFNPATKSVDGTFTLAPNTVAWAAGDALEQPHYFQTLIGGDTAYITQTQPRPRQYTSLGYYYNDNVGPGLRGFQIQNTVPASRYFGNGGTHGYPDIAYVSLGIWAKDFEAQAGEQAAFALHCNSKGCNRWNSAYDLFELDSSAGVDSVNYAPQSSTLAINLRGTGYSFSPTAFTAGTANITTVNATTINAGTVNMSAVTSTTVATGAITASSLASTGTITAASETLTGTSTSAAVNTGVVTATTLNGALSAANVTSGTLSAARLPVMGASGSSHAVGAVPDPGATAGTTRYLREDGTWVSPAGGVTSFNSRAGAVVPASGDYSVAQVTGAAPLASPALTGTPTAPTATAGDNSTKVATTGFVTTAVANGPAAPPLGSGLLLWNRFTEATGVAPVDYSGNGYVSTVPGGSANPTGSSEGWIFSPTTSQYYTLPAAVSASAHTFMAVICQNATTASLGWAQPTFLSSTNSGGLILGLFGYGSIYTPAGGSWAPSMGLASDFTSQYIPRTTSSATEGGCQVVTWEPGTTDHIYVGDQEVTYGSPNGGSQGNSSAGIGLGNLQVGGGVTLGTHLTNGNFDGILRELFVYSGTLTGNDLIRQVQNAKAIAIADGAPFVRFKSSSTTNSLVCLGDSITFGYLVTNSYCSTATLTPTETVKITRSAVSGRLALAIAASAKMEATPLYAEGAAHNTAIVFAGTNDLHETAAQILAEYGKITSDLHEIGYKVLWAPMLSRGGSNDAWKNTMNPVLVANAPLMADGFLNWSNDPLLGADGAYSNATYFNSGDQIHPTQTGANLMGVYATNVYNKLWGATETTPVTISTSTRTLGAADSWSIVTANSALTLPSCYGYAGSWTVKVNPGLTVTVKNAVAAQTIDGTDYSSSGLALTAGARTRFLVVPGASSTGGCTWSMQ